MVLYQLVYCHVLVTPLLCYGWRFLVVALIRWFYQLSVRDKPGCEQTVL